MKSFRQTIRDELAKIEEWLDRIEGEHDKPAPPEVVAAVATIRAQATVVPATAPAAVLPTPVAPAAAT